MAEMESQPTVSNRWPPNRNNMPDLSHLDNQLTLNLILKALVFKAGYANLKAKALWTGYVKLVDRLILEYNEAGLALDGYVHTPEDIVAPLFRATAHMESCLATLLKAVRFARRLRMDRDCPNVGHLTAISDEVLDRLKRIRAAVEQLEEKILDRSIRDADPVLMMVKRDGVEIGDEVISYHDLSRWIEELHRLATHLTDYREPVTEQTRQREHETE